MAPSLAVSFPIPTASTSESADSQRDERKRTSSPPSSFYAQSQAVLTAVTYFEPLHSGYVGSATKHKNRMRSALLVQLMAAFEFTMKDFIAQTLDATHIYDEAAKHWGWLEIDVPTVMSTREGVARLGAVLIHPLPGWQIPETMNSRYLDVYERQPIANSEIQPLRDLWIIRHSIAHNGGFVTDADARRLRAPSLRDRQVLVDVEYLQNATDLLRRIVKRLQDLIGPSLLKKWFLEGSTQTWEDDQDIYGRLKHITIYVESRIKELPNVDETMYSADVATYVPQS